ARIDRKPEPRGALRARNGTREVKLVEVEERGDEGERREQPDRRDGNASARPGGLAGRDDLDGDGGPVRRTEECPGERPGDRPCEVGGRLLREDRELDRKSTRLNSSHDQISYA